MAFVQVVLMEATATPSGATVRNSSNYAALSKLRELPSNPASIALRADSGSTAEARILLPLMEDDVADLLAKCREIRPRFALVEGVQLVHAAVALRAAFPDLPIIIDMHNVESVLREEIDRARAPRGLRSLLSIVLRRRFEACRSAERLAASVATEIWVCSEEDRERLAAIIGGSPIRVVPNPIPAWAENALPGPRAGTNEVLFVGHLAYPPNVAAVQVLVRDVMPRLRALVPDATLHVCGRRPRRRLARMVKSHGHRLSPDADDLLPLYRSAAVAAVPLHAGGGSRLKILEAMAAGCPVVATAKAVEGLDLNPGVHYRAAESAEQFASELAATLRSPAATRRQAIRSRDWVIQHYGEAERESKIQEALVAAGL